MADSMTAHKDFKERFGKFVNRAKLSPAGDNAHVGRYGGFPVAVSLTGCNDEYGMDSPPSVLMTCQIRYVDAPEDMDSDADAFDDLPVASLVKDGVIRVMLDETIGWISCFDAYHLFKSNDFARVLDDIITVIKRNGGHGNSDKCHNCRSHPVGPLTWADERVAQWCRQCLDKRTSLADRETRLTSVGGAALAAAAITAAILCAFLWVVLWQIEAWVFSKVAPVDDTAVPVPHLYLVVAAFVIGGAAGALAGRIVAIAPKRGRRVGCFVAGLAALFAALLGEAITISWFAKDAGDHIRFLEAVILIPYYWLVLRTEGALHIMTIIIMMVVAWLVSKPRVKSIMDD